MSIHLSGLHPVVRDAAEWCLDVADYYGIPVDVTSGFRSIERQAELRARFEKCVARGMYPGPGVCRYPANRPGDSAHNYGLAFDSTTPAQYQPAWNYIRQYIGFRVPGNDEIHAEVPGWRELLV